MADCRVQHLPSASGAEADTSVVASTTNKSSGTTTCHIRAGLAASSRLRWAAVAANNSSDGPAKASQRLVQAFAPILVSCSGSDEGETSPDPQSAAAAALSEQGSTQLLQQKSSITSTLDGMDSGNCSPHGTGLSNLSTSSSSSNDRPTPARMIAQADVQAGCYKTGVRYCLETWPKNPVLKVCRYGSVCAVCVCSVRL